MAQNRTHEPRECERPARTLDDVDEKPESAHRGGVLAKLWTQISWPVDEPAERGIRAVSGDPRRP